MYLQQITKHQYHYYIDSWDILQNKKKKKIFSL